MPLQPLKKVIFDCDVGPDGKKIIIKTSKLLNLLLDAHGIMLAEYMLKKLNSQIEILGITTAAGNTS